MVQSFPILQNMKRMSLLPVAINLAQLIACLLRFFPSSPLLITINSVLVQSESSERVCVCLSVHVFMCVCI